MYNHVHLLVKRLISLFGINALGIRDLLLLAILFLHFLHLFQTSPYHFVVPVYLERAIEFLLYPSNNIFSIGQGLF